MQVPGHGQRELAGRVEGQVVDRGPVSEENQKLVNRSNMTHVRVLMKCDCWDVGLCELFECVGETEKGSLSELKGANPVPWNLLPCTSRVPCEASSCSDQTTQPEKVLRSCFWPATLQALNQPTFESERGPKGDTFW